MVTSLLYYVTLLVEKPIFMVPKLNVIELHAIFRIYRNCKNVWCISETHSVIFVEC